MVIDHIECVGEALINTIGRKPRKVVMCCRRFFYGQENADGGLIKYGVFWNVGKFEQAERKPFELTAFLHRKRGWKL